MAQSTVSVEQQIADYEENLNRICRFFTATCRTESSDKPLFVWISFLPKKAMTDVENCQYTKIVKIGESIVEKHNFYEFPALQRWSYKSEAFLGKLGFNLSSHGNEHLISLSP